jgi:hypothetical protein
MCRTGLAELNRVNAAVARSLIVRIVRLTMRVCLKASLSEDHEDPSQIHNSYHIPLRNFLVGLRILRHHAEVMSGLPVDQEDTGRCHRA